jgi:hypothetical protein
LHRYGEADDPYLRVNESAPLLVSGSMLGEENEEYAQNWASDWRTSEPGARGGSHNASAPPQGAAARFGPYRSFAYRYLMASMRALQMRVSYMLASDNVVNDALFAYMALELGRSAADAPDAWCFLASTEFSWGRGVVSNFERWLYQRDEPPTVQDGVVTFPDARVSQTPAHPSNATPHGASWMTAVPHDWIAHAAPRGVIGFEIDRRFIHAVASPLLSAVIKVTLFDVLAGQVSVTQAHVSSSTSGGSALNSLGSQSTVGDGALKTFTFAAAPLLYRTNEEAHAAHGHRQYPHHSQPFDFEVRAVDSNGTPQPLVLAMVRVVKTNSSTALVVTSPPSSPSSSSPASPLSSPPGSPPSRNGSASPGSDEGVTGQTLAYALGGAAAVLVALAALTAGLLRVRRRRRYRVSGSSVACCVKT